jgi:UDP-GlcNAc:undecaprenyl-phosphate GlcNAc-1-phosphate transferase
MGDSGAYLLGYTLACLSVMGALKTQLAITVAVPLLLFGVPIFDTVFAVVRRIIRLKPVMSHPDRGHLHHRLLSLGMTQRQVVLFIYGLSGILCLAAFLLYRR